MTGTGRPTRVQLQRTKGWRLPDAAVNVARPTRWGNPYRIGPDRSPAQAVALYQDHLATVLADITTGPELAEALAELAGHDLACWCPPTSPCHADVLLELANTHDPVAAGTTPGSRSRSPSGGPARPASNTPGDGQRLSSRSTSANVRARRSAESATVPAGASASSARSSPSSTAVSRSSGLSSVTNTNLGQTRGVGLTNEELLRRYHAGERIEDLMAAAEMSKPGLYDRLRRLGAEPRNTWAAHLDDDTIRAALDQHGSVNATAKALGVPRARLGAEAVRLGLRPAPASIPSDITAVYAAEGSIDGVAAHYQTTRPTAARWLRAAGVALRPGRKPRDT